MSLPDILILYNEPVLPSDHPSAASECDIIATADIIHQILSDGDFSVERLGVSPDLNQLFSRLRAKPPDALFNLFEGFADRPFTEDVVPAILEWCGISFTG